MFLNATGADAAEKMHLGSRHPSATNTGKTSKIGSFVIVKNVGDAVDDGFADFCRNYGGVDV